MRNMIDGIVVESQYDIQIWAQRNALDVDEDQEVIIDALDTFLLDDEESCSVHSNRLVNRTYIYQISVSVSLSSQERALICANMIVAKLNDLGWGVQGQDMED